ncbi:HAD-IIA family hydrolase [Thiolapillus sp.]
MTAFLLDMDGVLYHGKQVLPGAREFVAQVARFRHLFITNNPTRTPAMVADRLAEMGFVDIAAEQILTSAEATARWLSRQKPGFRYFAVGGGEGLHQALSQAGTKDEELADFVVVGEGPGLDYDTLTTGINLILSRGAQLVSTNPDASVDAWRNGKHLLLPGGGALTAPFEAATGQKAVVIGKPEKLLFEMAMERLAASSGDCIMIGDRPETDIAGAAAMNMRTALVRSGCFPVEAPWPSGLPRPNWDTGSLAELTTAFEAAAIF